MTYLITLNQCLITLNNNGYKLYPPYNIVKTGDHKFDIEIALAGFNKRQNVTSEVTIESKKEEKADDNRR